VFDINDICSLKYTLAENYLQTFQYPWQVLKGLKDFIVITGESLGKEYEKADDGIWIHKTADVAKSAQICGPCIIGAEAQVRHCAFIRGSALIGKGCVVGNSTEIKNSVLFDGVQVPHYNYIGDSILGYKVHLGAGAVTSNVKSDKSEIRFTFDGEVIDTQLKKFGAIIGDKSEIGCGSVLNPGTIIGRNTTVYPLTSIRGVRGSNCIVKSADVCVNKIPKG
jgi:NDP-sugar pyrophosphorylase family protein